MSQDFNERILACPALPTLPTIAIKLLELTRNPDVKMSDIARLVQNDIGLATKVLKTVNSSLYGLSSKCATVDRALAYLGLNTVKSIVLGFSIVDSVGKVRTGIDMDLYWRRTMAGAAAARHVAAASHRADPDEAFTASLFQDVGMLAAAVALKGEYLESIAGASSHDELFVFERQKLGFDHARVGADLASKWRLPTPVIDSIRHHHTPDDEVAPDSRAMVRISHLSKLMAEALIEASGAARIAHAIGRAVEWFELDRERVEQIFDRVRDDSRELAKMFDKSMGTLPDAQAILAEAGERLVEYQVEMQRQAEALRQTNAQLSHTAFTDGLTGAFNRKKFDEDFARAAANSKETNAALGVLFLDGDKFKSVNDTHGHQAGDAVLKELARRVTATIAEAGRVYRYGGEEFAVLIPGVDAPGAGAAAERIRAAIEAPEFDLAGVPGAPPKLKVTVSVGASSLSPGGDPASTLREADECVYAAKRGGRNRVCVYGHSPGVRSVESAGRGQPAGASAASSPASAAASLKILLIEDDALAASLLLAGFGKHAGVAVQWLRSGTAAMDHFKKCAANPVLSPGLIVTDLHLPGVDGFSLTKAARQQFGSIPIVMITSSEEAKDAAGAKAAGVSEFVLKTAVSASFGKWIKDVLDRYRAAPTPVAA